MSDSTTISWTDTTWNPIRGCSRVSAGCVNCYAERMAKRFAAKGQPYEGLVNGHGRWNGTVRLIPEHLADPFRWGRPRKVFVSSMSDLFHEALTNEQIAAVFGVMAATPQHTFQCLTKRARRMREWFAWFGEELRSERTEDDIAAETLSRLLAGFAQGELGDGSREDEDRQFWRVHDLIRDQDNRATWPLPHVWLGVSVENQEAADERIPELLATPAAVRFLSCEPLIGPVDLGQHASRLSWLIAGCESGPGRRDCDVAWLRSLRDQCADAGVAFFLKQAVELSWSRASYPSPQAERIVTHVVSAGEGSKRKGGNVIERPYLDGVQHLQFPGGGGR